MTTITVRLSSFDQETDAAFEDYVLAALHRSHPLAEIEVSTGSTGPTRVTVDGLPDDDLRAVIQDLWSDFCSESA